MGQKKDSITTRRCDYGLDFCSNTWLNFRSEHDIFFVAHGFENAENRIKSALLGPKGALDVRIAVVRQKKPA